MKTFLGPLDFLRGNCGFFLGNFILITFVYGLSPQKSRIFIFQDFLLENCETDDTWWIISGAIIHFLMMFKNFLHKNTWIISWRSWQTIVNVYEVSAVIRRLLNYISKVWTKSYIPFRIYHQYQTSGRRTRPYRF